MLISSFLKRSNSAIRSDWSMSPWIWPTEKPERLRLVASSRTVVLRLLKTIAFLNSSERRMSRSASRFLSPRMTITRCSISALDCRRPGDLDRLRLVEELGRQFLDRRRHGRREQQGLPRLGQFRADFLDVGDEAHVEHAVGFVDHQQIAAVEHDLAAAEQVHQPARGRDQHVDALFERLDLVAHLNAADQQRHRELVIFAVFDEILGDLRGKLAGRLEDQRARHPRAAAAMGEDVDHRQDEAGGLAGAGLGDADDVAAHQDRRDDPALDRRRRVVAAVGNSAQQFVRKAEIGKRHEKSGKNAVWSAQRRGSRAIAPRGPKMSRKR